MTMPSSHADLSRVAEIEARQDEVLRQLDQLERQLEAALREFGGERWLKVVAAPISSCRQPEAA